MSGVRVITYLLANDSNMIAAIPADSIMAGVIPLGTQMPVIGVQMISTTRRNTVAMTEGTRLVTERVQVTPMAGQDQSGGPYPFVKAALALARKACRNRSGTVNDVDVDSILPDTEGPDFEDPDDHIVQQSQDFIVRWRETT